MYWNVSTNENINDNSTGVVAKSHGYQQCVGATDVMTRNSHEKNVKDCFHWHQCWIVGGYHAARGPPMNCQIFPTLFWRWRLNETTTKKGRQLFGERKVQKVHPQRSTARENPGYANEKRAPALRWYGPRSLMVNQALIDAVRPIDRCRKRSRVFFQCAECRECVRPRVFENNMSQGKRVNTKQSAYID